METLVKKNMTLYYEVIRNKRKEYIVKVDGNKVIIDAPDYANKKDIEMVLNQQFMNLYQKTNPDKIFKWVHINGIKYKLICKKGKKDSLILENNEMIITSKVDEHNAYHKILKDYMKRAVETELTKLMYDAMNVFKDIKFPSIEVRYRSSVYGLYNKVKNHIVISSNLARREFIYIKVVLYHELTHALILDHSDKFLEEFERRLPKGPYLDGKLKLTSLGDYF